MLLWQADALSFRSSADRHHRHHDQEGGKGGVSFSWRRRWTCPSSRRAGCVDVSTAATSPQVHLRCRAEPVLSLCRRFGQLCCSAMHLFVRVFVRVGVECAPVSSRDRSHLVRVVALPLRPVMSEFEVLRAMGARAPIPNTSPNPVGPCLTFRQRVRTCMGLFRRSGPPA